MTAVAAPFGFRPVFHPTGLDRGIQRTIASGYGTAIYKGMPVILDTNGTLIAGTAAADILGIFNGVEYIDATGKPNYSTFWPAGQTVQSGTVPKAYVWEDALTYFEVQANGPITQAAIGSQADVVNPGAGNALIGTSTAALGAPVAAGAQAQFRIMDFSKTEDNSPGDAFTIVQVQIARQQFVSNKVAV